MNTFMHYINTYCTYYIHTYRTCRVIINFCLLVDTALESNPHHAIDDLVG